jgi:hypothetical protein
VTRFLIRVFIIASIVLLLGSLIGVITTRALPTEVEQETSLLNYEQEGRFDYLIHLKPSYLFGPPPVEPPPPPPNPKYPTEIIRKIEMSFTYMPDRAGSHVVRVMAVLENPGIWQKEILLVPYTTGQRTFTVDFLLDIKEFNEIYDDIEEETGISLSERKVTIIAEAELGNGDRLFIQHLPIKLGETIIEFDSNLSQTVEGATGRFSYLVFLKENSVYEQTVLYSPSYTPFTPPSSSETLKPGEVIFSKLVDKIDVTFYYQFLSDKPVSKVTADVVLTAFLRATGPEDAELWSKKFPLLCTRESGDFNVSFPLDLVGHLKLLETIRKETDVSAESNSVTITAEVNTVAETPVGVINETFTQALEGTTTGNLLEWNEELRKSKPGSITKTEMVPNPNKYLGLPVDKLRLLTPILGSIFLIFFITSLVLYKRFKLPEPPLAEKEASQAGKKYGGLMAEATGQTPLEGERIVSLGSMEDLIKVADELGKPVIHQPPSTSEKRHAYYVFDVATRYQYVFSTRGKERRSNARKTK